MPVNGGHPPSLFVPPLASSMHRPTLSLAALGAAALFSACASQRAATPTPAAGDAVARGAAAPACSIATDLVVAATTDVHGRLRGWDYYANAPETVRGLTRAATIVDSVRAAN